MSNQPGCYGSPTCCQPNSVTCKTCVFLSACVVDSEQRAIRLREKFGVESFKHFRVKKSINPKESLPRKSEEIVENLRIRGVDLKKEIKARNNPFVHNPPKFMRLAVSGLLTNKSGLLINDLSSAYVNKLGFTKENAHRHVEIAIGALKSVDAIHEKLGKMFIS